MPRRVTGRYEKSSVGGEEVACFVPTPLPPVAPPLAIEGVLADRLHAAEHALTRLDLAGDLVPSLGWPGCDPTSASAASRAWPPARCRARCAWKHRRPGAGRSHPRPSPPSWWLCSRAALSSPALWACGTTRSRSRSTKTASGHSTLRSTCTSQARRRAARSRGRRSPRSSPESACRLLLRWPGQRRPEPPRRRRSLASRPPPPRAGHPPRPDVTGRHQVGVERARSQ